MKQLFDDFDAALKTLGDAHVSRFYSDDANLVISCDAETRWAVIDYLSGQCDLTLYDVGVNDDRYMLTFKLV